MNGSRWKLLVASVAAFLLVLLPFALQDQGKAADREAEVCKTVVCETVVGGGVVCRAVVCKAVVRIAGVHTALALKGNVDPDDDLLGACSREDRERFAHNPSLKFKEQLRVCGKETWADKQDNLACLAAVVPRLSRSCATCFTDMASCAYDHCKGACMFDSKSKGCERCANKHCQTRLVECTGVARADLP